MPEAARPSGAADPIDQQRQALLAQLAYLIDEIEVLKGLIGRVPEPVLNARPLPDDLSIKETYGLIATRDAEVRLPRLRRMIADDQPVFEAVDDQTLVAQADWNDRPIDAILDQVQDARRMLVAYARALPAEAWTRTARFDEPVRNVYEMLYAIIQQDAEYQRTLGYRLHETNLTERPQDLPK